MSESESEPSSQTTPDSTPQEAKGEAVGLRKLLKHSGIYSLAPLVQRAASILLIPILTYALREDRGRYGALELSDFLILLIDPVKALFGQCDGSQGTVGQPGD